MAKVLDAKRRWYKDIRKPTARARGLSLSAAARRLCAFTKRVTAK